MQGPIICYTSMHLDNSLTDNLDVTDFGGQPDLQWQATEKINKTSSY